MEPVHKIYRTPFADVYPLYVKKVERKGRTQAELDEVNHAVASTATGDANTTR